MSSVDPQFEEHLSMGKEDFSDRHPNYYLALALFFVPLCCYLFLIGKWSLDGDEIYTLHDSMNSAWEILTSSRKPIYYLICHYTIQLSLPLEFTLRLPAAVSSALIAPTYYLLLWRPRASRVAVYAAILIVANPWLFELSQFARFYSLMFWFASLSVLSLYRWLADKNHGWFMLFLLAAILATFTHNTAAAIIPAGILAALVTMANEDRNKLLSYLKKRWPIVMICAVAIAVVFGIPNYTTLRDWLVLHHEHMYYSLMSLLGATAHLSGLQLWALAFIPLIRPIRSWTRDEILFSLMIAGVLLPLLLLVGIGEEVAPRYLLASLPCLFVLTAHHWSDIAAYVSSFSLRCALGIALLATHVPYLVSTLTDGNHYDYRSAVQFVESLALDDPIIASTSHGMYMHYATGGQQVAELGRLSSMNGGNANEESFSWRVMSRLIREADSSGRVLVLVSREDRFALDAAAMRWMSERFCILNSIEKPRYDHRRQKLVIYQHRPDTRAGQRRDSR